MTPSDRALKDALREADGLHQAGHLSEAARVYEAILKDHPGQFDALFLLGWVRLRSGQAMEAEQVLAQAAVLDPASVDALSLRANALQQMGRIPDALVTVDKALGLNPRNAVLWSNRGNLLLALGRSADAVASYDRAVALNPEFADALCNRAVALLTGGNYRDAEADLDRALSLRPDHADALEHRGIALAGQGRHEEALRTYESALKHDPSNAALLLRRGDSLLHLDRCLDAVTDYDRVVGLAPHNPDAWLNRGVALSRLGRHGEALTSYDHALRLRPDFAEAWHNRGSALLALGDQAGALSSYDRAIAARPDYFECWKSRGVLLLRLQAHGDALESFNRALSLNRDDVETLYYRASALSPLSLFEECIADCETLLDLDPDYPFARGLLLDARLHCCDWQDLNKTRETLSADVAAEKPVIGPFAYLAVSDSPKEQSQCARTLVRDSYPGASPPLWQGERYGHDRIRIAYLSADFRDHAVARLIAGVFEHHDRTRFETIALSLGSEADSSMRKRLEGAFDRFLDVERENEAAIARRVRELEVDIAIDLMGYTRGGRPGILALRPAPLQVNYLGYPGTLGANYIDYLIADSVVIPDEQRAFYAENIAYLPDSYQCNDSQRRIAEQAPSRKEAGLPETGFVFCCFNHNYKITPEIFDIWMRLLASVEESVLWLLEDHPAATSNLRRQAEARGVSPHRLIFAKRAPLDQHLARLQHAGLLLDTLPYGAHTTASDALWVGVPVLTCLGTSFAGRVAASLLSSVGLPKLIRHSLEDYERCARDLALNPAAVLRLREQLAKNRTNAPLFDTMRVTRNLETAYRMMWERQQRGEPPMTFSVGKASLWES
jgi:protein O-GlcNAc transferase